MITNIFNSSEFPVNHFVTKLLIFTFISIALPVPSKRINYTVTAIHQICNLANNNLHQNVKTCYLYMTYHV